MQFLLDWFLNIVDICWSFFTKHFSNQEFIYAAFGAFLGFRFSMRLEKKSKKREFLEKKISYLNNVYLELDDALENLKTCTSDEIFYIDIPVYEALVQSASILDFVEDSFYIDLMKVYLEIKLLKKSEEREDIGDDDIETMRTSTTEKIASLLPLLKQQISKLEKRRNIFKYLSRKKRNNTKPEEKQNE